MKLTPINFLLIIVAIIIIYNIYVNTSSLKDSDDNSVKEPFSFVDNLKNDVSNTINKAMDSGTISKIKNLF